MPIWTVTRDDGPWQITRDGAAVETSRSHYDADEVLAKVERIAGQTLLWRLVDGGFESEPATDALLTDHRERLVKAVSELDRLYSASLDGRLAGKAEGVRLALSYLDEIG